jgi:hypothetical protein
MKYEELAPIDRGVAAVDLASADEGRMSKALIRLALHDPDWQYVQAVCVCYANDPHPWVRRNCATCLGHLARLHGMLELNSALPVLRRLEKDPETSSWAEAALHDVYMYIKAQNSQS